MSETSRWDRNSKQHGFVFFLIALLIPIFPTDVLTFVAGLSMISTPKFTLANILGRAPYLFLMSLIGAQGIGYITQGIAPTAWVLIILALAVIYMTYRYLLPIVKREIFSEES